MTVFSSPPGLMTSTGTGFTGLTIPDLNSFLQSVSIPVRELLVAALMVEALVWKWTYLAWVGFVVHSTHC